MFGVLSRFSSYEVLRQLSLVRAAAARATHVVSRLIAPDYCASCDCPVRAGAIFCPDCGPCPSRDLPPNWDEIHVAGTYAPPLSTAILRMKFGQRADLAYRLAALLPSIEGGIAPGTLVVPVPLHLLRLCERGFNPSALMARCHARRMRATFAPRLLERLRHTPQQSRLPAPERRSNVAGAFAVRGASAAGRHVLLVDDVVTTGSTIEACRGALYAAGVVHVRVIALARA